MISTWFDGLYVYSVIYSNMWNFSNAQPLNTTSTTSSSYKKDPTYSLSPQNHFTRLRQSGDLSRICAYHWSRWRKRSYWLDMTPSQELLQQCWKLPKWTACMKGHRRLSENQSCVVKKASRIFPMLLLYDYAFKYPFSQYWIILSFQVDRIVSLLIVVFFRTFLAYSHYLP